MVYNRIIYVYYGAAIFLPFNSDSNKFSKILYIYCTGTIRSLKKIFWMKSRVFPLPTVIQHTKGCKMCGKVFMKSYYYYLLCLDSFTKLHKYFWSWALVQFIRILQVVHDGIRFSCDLCELTTTTLPSLDRHMKKIHKSGWSSWNQMTHASNTVIENSNFWYRIFTILYIVKEQFFVLPQKFHHFSGIFSIPTNLHLKEKS